MALTILSIAVIVMVIADPMGWLSTRGALLDPEEVLSAEFAFDDLPFGLEIVSAARLPGGDRVVRLAHPDYAPEPDPLEEESEAQEESGDGESDTESEGEREGESDQEGDGAKKSMSFEPWTPPKVELVDGTPPMEVFFVFPDEPEGAVRSFGGKQGGEGGSRGRRGMGMMVMAGPGQPIPISGGDLDWGEGRVGFRHERTFSEVSATDEFRVNLSESQRYCVLVIRWPTDHSGSVERAEELLAAFVRVEL